MGLTYNMQNYPSFPYPHSHCFQKNRRISVYTWVKKIGFTFIDGHADAADVFPSSGIVPVCQKCGTQYSIEVTDFIHL